MKVRLPLLLVSVVMMSCFSVATATDYYRTIGSGQTAGWTDADTWMSGSAAGAPATWDDLITDGTAFVTAGDEQSILTIDSGTIASAGFHLLGGKLAVTGDGTLQLADEAVIRLASDSDLSLGGKLAFGANGKLDMRLEDNARLTLGSDANRIATALTINADAAAGSTLTLYLSKTNGASGLLNVSGTTLEHLYLDGVFNLCEGSGTAVSDIGSATLHLMAGSTFFVNNGLKSSSQSSFSNKVVLEGDIALTVYGNANVRIDSDFIHAANIEGANVTANNQGRFYYAGNMDLGTGSLNVASGTGSHFRWNLIENGTAEMGLLSIGSRAKVTLGGNSSTTAGKVVIVSDYGSLTIQDDAVLNAEDFSIARGEVTLQDRSVLAADKVAFTSGYHMVIQDNAEIKAGEFIAASARTVTFKGTSVLTADKMELNKGATYLQENSRITTKTLSLGNTDGATGTLNLSGGASLTVEDGFVVAAISNGTGLFNMSGGTLDMARAVLKLTESGKATVTMTGGEMKVLGLDFAGGKDGVAATSGAQGAFYLGAQSDGTGSGVVEIGAGGIGGLSVQGDYIPSLNLGQGTIRAAADWKTNEGGDVAIHMTSAAGTTFDPNGHTITINHNLDGDGKLILDGTGTLVLNGAIAHTGGTEVNNGILKVSSLIDNVTLNGGTLVATELGNNIVINGGTLQSQSGNLIIAGGIELSAGSSLWVNKDAGGTLTSVCTLTLGGDFVLDGGALFIYIQSSDLYDSIVASSLSRAAGNLVLESGTLNLMGVGETFDYTVGYDIFRGFAAGGDPGIDVTGYDTGNWQHYWEDGTLKFNALSIPEPSLALLFGFSSLLLSAVRRRRG